MPRAPLGRGSRRRCTRNAGSRDATRQLETAERWLAAHDQDATLLYALGRLCERESLWGKAQTYLEASLALDDHWRIRVTLGELHARLGRHDLANTHLAAALKALVELAASDRHRRRANATISSSRYTGAPERSLDRRQALREVGPWHVLSGGVDHGRKWTTRNAACPGSRNSVSTGTIVASRMPRVALGIFAEVALAAHRCHHADLHVLPMRRLVPHVRIEMRLESPWRDHDVSEPAGARASSR